MKRFKQFLLMIMTFVLLFSLSACIIIPVKKYYDISAEEIVSIQFYDLRIQEGNGEPGFDKIYEPAYTLSEKDNEAFLDDFSNLKFSDTIIFTLVAMDPSFSYGDWVIRINFSNGQYTFYSSAGYGETFDADGNTISTTHLSCDDEKLEELIKKYYKTA